MSVSLKVNFLGRELAGPVIAASGTFGYGEEYADILDLSALGGVAGNARRADEQHRAAEPGRCAFY